ncbi:MAG: nuclear transport factor 2 family protein [Paludibaculum sp.]
MTIAQLDAKLNNDILTGKALEAFDELYDENVVMQENSNEPFVGKAVNRQREIDFFSSIEEFHGASVLSSAVNGDVTLSEWLYDVTFKGGTRFQLAQVAVRRWKDGKVVNERFYYSK